MNNEPKINQEELIIYVSILDKRNCFSSSAKKAEWALNSNVPVNSNLYLKITQGRNQGTRWVLFMKQLEVQNLMQVYLEWAIAIKYPEALLGVGTKYVLYIKILDILHPSYEITYCKLDSWDYH